MKVFLDTNIFLEYLCERSKALVVRNLLDVIEDKSHTAIFSSASFCTIAYYVELSLKERGIHKPEKTLRTRDILNVILEIATIADVDHASVIAATNDMNFTDFEDSMQYQCALKAQCDVVVTFNTKDYKNSDSENVKILTPEEFLEVFE